MRRPWLPLVLGMLLLGSVPARGVEWGFETLTLGPLVLRNDGVPMQLRAEQCGWCHTEEYAEWSASRHRTSWTNATLQAGYIVEPQDFCVYCHAPLAEQTAEVLANRAWYRAQHPRTPAAPVPARLAEPYAAEGVTCVACHWRAGQLHGPTGPEDAAHPVSAAAELRDAAFCAGCHEFNMPEGHDGTVSFTDEPMQKTYSEWQAWGGPETCQDCHMPGGAHTFRGANDRALLEASVDVAAVRTPEGLLLCLESVGVGHHLPTGDLFRRLSLQVDRGAGFETVLELGRTFQLVADAQTGEIHKVLQADTALRPGEPREVLVPLDDAGGAVQWRLRYHYGSAQDEALGLVAREALVVTLAEGRL